MSTHVCTLQTLHLERFSLIDTDTWSYMFLKGNSLQQCMVTSRRLQNAWLMTPLLQNRDTSRRA